METTPSLRILLLEDQGLVRAGMKALVQIAEPRAQVYEAGTFESAIECLTQASIDVAFLDYDLKAQRTGLDVLKYIRSSELETHAVMLSARDDKHTVLECLQEGASGYILKDNESDGLFQRALRTVFEGGVFLPASVIGRGGHSPVPTTTAKVPPESFGLSGRLLDVLYYCCQGLPNKAIANKLGIAEGTVRKDYMTKLFRTFKVARRTELLIEVSRRGLLIPKPNSTGGVRD